MQRRYRTKKYYCGGVSGGSYLSNIYLSKEKREAEQADHVDSAAAQSAAHRRAAFLAFFGYTCYDNPNESEGHLCIKFYSSATATSVGS